MARAWRKSSWAAPTIRHCDTMRCIREALSRYLTAMSRIGIELKLTQQR